MKAIRTLPQIENVISDGRATLKIPQGFNYEQLILRLKNVTIAQIEGIRLSLGGKDIIPDMSGQQINMINKYNGLDDADGHLSLNFADYSSRTVDGMTMPAIDTVNYKYSNFNLELKLATGLTNPKIEAIGVIGDGLIITQADDATKDRFRAQKRQTEQFSAAGEKNLEVSLGSVEGALLRQLYIFDPDGIVTDFQVVKDSQNIIQYQPRETIEALQKQALHRTPQKGLFVIDPILHGIQGDSLSPLRDDGKTAAMQFQVKTSGPGRLDIFSDLLATHENV